MVVIAPMTQHDASVELQQMRYVLAVADTANFTRAAERCHVVQSALSHQIARLERELGARLFERTSRRVQLTPAGEAFVPAAREAVGAADRARAEVSAAAGEVRGRLAIGAIPTLTAVDLPQALRDFHRRCPRVDISLHTGASERMVEQVRRSALDVAFIGVPPAFPTPGTNGHELARGELVAVVPPHHPLAGRREVALERLAEEVFVDFPAKSAARAQSDEAFAAAGLRRQVAFEVGGVDFLARLVDHGLGIALLPAGFAARLPHLRTVPVRDAPSRAERLVWRRGRPSAAVAAFLNELGYGGGSDEDRQAGPRAPNTSREQ